MLNCIYHPTNDMRVVEDDEYETLLATGVWFKHPNEAKKVREDYEKRILDERNSADRKTKKSNGK
jgi:hypothetical protein